MKRGSCRLLNTASIYANRQPTLLHKMMARTVPNARALNILRGCMNSIGHSPSLGRFIGAVLVGMLAIAGELR